MKVDPPSSVYTVRLTQSELVTLDGGTPIIFQNPSKSGRLVMLRPTNGDVENNHIDGNIDYCTVSNNVVSRLRDGKSCSWDNIMGVTRIKVVSDNAK